MSAGTPEHARCDATYDDGYRPPYTCAREPGHRGVHNSRTLYPVRWTDDTHGATPANAKSKPLRG